MSDRMDREDLYLLGCLYAIQQLTQKGSTEFAVKNGGKWETVPWKEITDWIEAPYGIGEEE